MCGNCRNFKCRFNTNMANPYNQSQQKAENMNLDLTPVIDITNKFMESTNDTINEMVSKFNDTNEVVLSLNENLNIIGKLVGELRSKIDSHISEQIPANSSLASEDDISGVESIDYNVEIYNPNIEKTYIEKKGFLGLGKSKWVEEK